MGYGCNITSVMANDSHIVEHENLTENQDSVSESLNSDLMDVSFSEESFTNSDGRTDNEFTSNTNTQEHENIVTPNDSDESDESDESFEDSFISDIEADDMNDVFINLSQALSYAAHNETPMAFIAERSRVTHPELKHTYFEHLSNLAFEKLFLPYFSNDLNKHVEHPDIAPAYNLIDFLDLEGHGRLVQALDLSKKIAFIEDNEANILDNLDPENFEELITALGFQNNTTEPNENKVYNNDYYNKHKIVLNDVAFINSESTILTQLFSKIFESLKHFYNINDISKNDVWQPMLIVIEEAFKLKLTPLVNTFIDFFPFTQFQQVNNQLVRYNLIDLNESYLKITLSDKYFLDNLPEISHALSDQQAMLTDLIKHHYYLIRSHENIIAWTDVNTTFTAIYVSIEVAINYARKEKTKALLTNNEPLDNTPDPETLRKLKETNIALNTLSRTELVTSIFTQHYIKLSNQQKWANINTLATTPRYLPAQSTNLNIESLQSALSQISVSNRRIVSPDKANNHQPHSSPFKRKNNFGSPEQTGTRSIPVISPLHDYDNDDIWLNTRPDSPQSPYKKLKTSELNIFNDQCPHQNTNSNIIGSDAQFDR